MFTGVCAAACLDSWEVFGTLSMFLGADWEGPVESGGMGCWHVCALLEDRGRCLPRHALQGSSISRMCLQRAFLAEKKLGPCSRSPRTPVPQLGQHVLSGTQTGSRDCEVLRRQGHLL